MIRILILLLPWASGVSPETLLCGPLSERREIIVQLVLRDPCTGQIYTLRHIMGECLVDK